MNTTSDQSKLSRLQLIKQGRYNALPEEGQRVIPLDLLIEDPRNERKTYRNMEDLTKTVKAVGVIEPITVVPYGEGKYMITTGHRRYRAAKAAGLKEIAVIVAQAETELRRRRKSIISNIQREDVGPVEMALGLQALKEDDPEIESDKQLAELIGKSPSWVSGMLKVLSIPQDLRGRLIETKVPVSYDAAMEISRLPNHDQQAELIGLALDGASNLEIRNRARELKHKTRPRTVREQVTVDGYMAAVTGPASSHAKQKMLTALEALADKIKS